MKRTINFYDFCREFEMSDRNDNFSYQGKCVLFDYLEEYEQEISDEIELDVVSLCGDYREGTARDIASDYDIVDDSNAPLEDTVRGYLGDNTTICGEFEEGDETVFVYAEF